MTTVITKQNFDTEVLNKATNRSWWISAAWCGPCRLVIPAVEKLAEHYQGA